MIEIEWDRLWSEFVAVTYPKADFSPATHCKLRQVRKELSAFVHTTADLTVFKLAEWRDSKPDRAPQTFNSLVGFARKACRFAMAMGYLSVDPFNAGTFRRRVLGKAKAKRHLSRDEIGRLLGHLEGRKDRSWRDGRLNALAVLLAYTGLRAKEALRLRVEDLDFEKRTLAVVARHRLKTRGSEATIVLAPECIATLREWANRCGSIWFLPGSRRAGPWIYGSNGRRPADFLDAAAVEAGLPRGTTLLMLRHSLATHARTYFGMDAKSVQQMLRHADVRTQEHYLERDLDNLHEQVKNLNFRIYRAPAPAAPAIATPRAATA